MKTIKLSLDEEELDTVVGLVRLAKPIPDHEFFFKVNEANNFCFSRLSDLHISGVYYDYFFSRFEGYSTDQKTCFQFISNKSIIAKQKKIIPELFSDEENRRLILKDHQDVDYIVKTSDEIHDFSLILLPANLTFPVQEFSVDAKGELYQIIHYYE